MLLNFNKIYGASEIFLFYNVVDQRILYNNGMHWYKKTKFIMKIQLKQGHWLSFSPLAVRNIRLA